MPRRTNPDVTLLGVYRAVRCKPGQFISDAAGKTHTFKVFLRSEAGSDSVRFVAEATHPYTISDQDECYEALVNRVRYRVANSDKLAWEPWLHLGWHTRLDGTFTGIGNKGEAILGLEVRPFEAATFATGAVVHRWAGASRRSPREVLNGMPNARTHPDARCPAGNRVNVRDTDENRAAIEKLFTSLGALQARVETLGRGLMGDPVDTVLQQLGSEDEGAG